MTLEEMKLRWPKLIIESIPNFIGIYNIKNILNQVLATSLELDKQTVDLMDHINNDWAESERMSQIFLYLHIDPFKVSIKANGEAREYLFDTPYKFDLNKLKEFNDKFKEVSLNFNDIFHCHRCKKNLSFNRSKDLMMDSLLDEKTPHFEYKDEENRHFCNQCAW